MVNTKTGHTLTLLVAGMKWPPETFLQRLLRGLLDHGVDITVATAARPSAEWLARTNFHWLHTPHWKGPIPVRLLRLARLWTRATVVAPEHLELFRQNINPHKRAAARLHQWHRFLPFAGGAWDVIYFPWNSAAITYLPLFDFGAPVLLSCRGSQVNIAPHNPRRAAFKDGLRLTFQRAAAVHCVSEDIKQAAMAYGLDPTKAHVIRPAVDPDFFYPASQRSTERDDRFRIISVGSLIWRKGYEYALTAIRQLVDHNLPVHYQIIGSGPERQRVLYTIHDLGLQDNVTLSGRLSPEEVRDSLQQSDVFLLSSFSEGISNAVLEAMACGLPVVTTDCGGMREAVQQGVEGFVAPLQDTASIAGALETLWQRPQQRQEMGRAGRRRIEADFALRHQASQFLTMFQAL